MVNKSRKIEVKEIKIPNMIKGVDLTFSSFLVELFENAKFLIFFLERRWVKGLITIKF